MFENIESLTLISSESCNLNCSYCNIAHDLSPERHKQIALEVKEALKDGTYLRNVLAVCDKYNINKNNIKNLNLWGQEPTLTLDEVSKAFPDFYKEFPNLNHFCFSTNSVSFFERILNYITTIDNTINHEGKIEIQFSFDGTDITKKSRGIDPQIILKNIESLFLGLNQIELKNVKVECHFHNVMTVELMRKLLNDDNEFFNFFDDIKNIIDKFQSIIKNKNVSLWDYFSPGIINPYNATVEDGKTFAKFYKKCIKFQPEPIGSWESLVGMFLNAADAFQDIHDIENPNVDNVVSAIAYYEQLKDESIEGSFISHISHQLTCGWGNGDLKIRYDGTLIHCHNVLFGMTEDELSCHNATDLRHRMQRQLLKHGYYPNLNDKNADEEFQKFADRSYFCCNSSFLYSFYKNVNLMILLLKCNQISESYKDINKLLRHAYILTTILACWDNNLMETGSGYGRTAGHIRFYCNGFIDFVDEFWRDIKGV